MNLLKVAACIIVVATCGTVDIASAQEVPKAAGIDELPAVSFCRIPDAKAPSSAFVVEEHGSQADVANYWMTYSCREPCPSWKACVADAVSPDGSPLKSRDEHQKQLAFVTDKMGGYLRYSPAGEKTLVFHTGGGGTTYEFQPVVEALEAQTNVRAVQLVWASEFWWGWYTRTSPEPRTVVQQSERPAAVLKWIHDNLARGHDLGTVGVSMGTVATLGPVLWHGLDPLISYQALIGGPPMWDVNASCKGPNYPNGLAPYVTGYYADDGKTRCQIGAGNGNRVCQVPSPIGFYSLWESLFDHLSMSHHCSQGDGPYPPFDLSSMRFTVRDWTVHHRIDFLVNLSGPVPPELKKFVPSQDKLFMGDGLRAAIRQTIQAGIKPLGDEGWGLGHVLQVYNMLQPKAEVSWATAPGQHGLWGHSLDSFLPVIKRAMELE